MRIDSLYSHLNGLEFLKVHKLELWNEICQVIALVDGPSCKTKVSKEKRSPGKLLYAPREFNRSFKLSFEARGWNERRNSYWVTANQDIVRKTMQMKPPDQRKAISDSGVTPIKSYNQTDFVKDRVAVEVQFGKYPFVAYDLFVKHMGFFVDDLIDVGVEILPMKSMQVEMSSGVAYYEGELFNLMRQGRGVPAVPLILIGVSP